MNVNEVYELVQLIANKNQNGYISPDDFNLTMPQAERSHLYFLLGMIEQYQNGRPIPRVGLGNAQLVLQKLSPFIDTPTTLTVTSGLANMPNDLEAVVAMYTSNMSEIDFVQQDTLASRLKSVIDPIATSPIYLFENAKFRFYPDTITAPKLSYVKTPVYMKWAFTLDPVTGLPVYNLVGSEQPKWFNTDLMQIIGIALKMFGVSFSDADLVNYSNQLKVAE